MKTPIEIAREGLALAEKATPGPWRWWTSNSHSRLTGPDGVDGGIISAYRAIDGMSCLSVKRENMAMIESACNNYATLCRKLIEVAELANVYKEGPRTRSGHYCAYETAITKILETLNDK